MQELSGAFGGVLERQTGGYDLPRGQSSLPVSLPPAFVALCIEHILSMYGRVVSNPPRSVVLVTHSMV